MESAFDKVPHELLLHKLKSYGFGVDVLTLLKSYLHDRKVRTKVEDTYSDWSENRYINIGVPQG